MKNVLSIDLEDWFCAYNFSHSIKKEEWDQCELRVLDNTMRLLDLMDRFKVKATFFVLGWIADKVPSLIREIENRNHEIALHGYNHLLITQITPAEFEDDVKKGLDALKRLGVRQPIVGFRAPSFTIVEKTKWALPILEKFNIQYDSSVFPIGFHPDYGIPDAPLKPYKITDQLYEVPLGCIEVLGKRFPCSGGAYFRFFPYVYTHQCIAMANAQGRSIVFYLHPWEIDPDQPRVKLSLPRSIRHYYGLGKTYKKLERLFNDFEFTTIKEMLKI